MGPALADPADPVELAEVVERVPVVLEGKAPAVALRPRAAPAGRAPARQAERLPSEVAAATAAARGVAGP